MEQKDMRRVTATLSQQKMMMLRYWARKKNMTINEYLRDAVESYIKWEQADHSKPTQEVERLNKRVEAVEGLRLAMYNLQRDVTTGFDTMSAVTHGENEFLNDVESDLDILTTKEIQFAKKIRRKKKKVNK